MTYPAVLSALCRECARDVYGTRAPSTRYADSVADLLMGTAATESHLRYRRQGGFSLASDRGAWGLWQTEVGSVADGLKMLAARQELRYRAAKFLYGSEGDIDMEGLLAMEARDVLRVIHSWDRLAVLFARLHYFRVAAPVPHTLMEQAAYWKEYYNTRLGKGTPMKYLNDWNQYIAGAV